MPIEEKISTIKIRESTKELLKNFDFAKKGVSYEDIIKILIQKVEAR